MTLPQILEFIDTYASDMLQAVDLLQAVSESIEANELHTARQLLQENHIAPWLNDTIIKTLRENV